MILLLFFLHICFAVAFWFLGVPLFSGFFVILAFIMPFVFLRKLPQDPHKYDETEESESFVSQLLFYGTDFLKNASFEAGFVFLYASFFGFSQVFLFPFSLFVLGFSAFAAVLFFVQIGLQKYNRFVCRFFQANISAVMIIYGGIFAMRIFGVDNIQNDALFLAVAALPILLYPSELYFNAFHSSLRTAVLANFLVYYMFLYGTYFFTGNFEAVSIFAITLGCFFVWFALQKLPDIIPK